MEPAYHLLLNGHQEGPFTVSELQRKLAVGEIQSGHLVWRPGFSGWMPIGQMLPPPLPLTDGVVPPLLGTALPRPAARRASTLWWWVTAALLLVMGTLGFFVYQGVQAIRDIGSDTVAYRPLFKDRARHTPKWVESSFEADGPADEPDGKALTLMRYRSPAGELAAYLTPDPQDGKKHPAMVWAHGGFGGIGSEFWDEASKRRDESVRAFREKRIVLMFPSWRGENDNPGRFELLYGEVDDLLAAVDHVKSLPYVDPERVYLGGQSAGATLALLAASASDAPRATFCFGALLDGVSFLEDDGYGNAPYDTDSTIDHRLRSPMRYARYIRRPVFYFDGEIGYELEAAAKMRARAPGMFHPFRLTGRTWENVHPVSHLIAEKILADTGAESTIVFTEEELSRRYDETYAITLASEIGKWMTNGGELKAVLKEADAEDVIPRTTADVEAVVAAVKHLESRDEFSPSTTAAMAVLATLRGDIEDDEIETAFDAEAAGPLVTWSQQRLAHPTEMDAAETESFLILLSYLVDTGHAQVPDLVVAAVRDPKVPGHSRWSAVFRSFHDDHVQTEQVMRAFAVDPPDGLTGVLLLDAANSLFHDGWKGTHPFDNSMGASLLRRWLEDEDAELSSYAHSAAFGSAFLRPEHRGDLIALALRHADRGVRLEGAWSDLKSGGAEGLPRLQAACLDVHQSKRAREYLKELDREGDVPAEAKEPAFAAQATLSRWLQHPNELNADPLSLEVMDRRTMLWPPTNDQREMWLVKFTYQFPNQPDPKTGYGCVGSMTWSSFEEFDTPPSPEELYLHHCTLELQRNSHHTETAAKDRDEKQLALEALQKANPGMFDTLTVPAEADSEEPVKE